MTDLSRLRLMEIATLLADPSAIRLACIRPSLSVITLIIKAMAAQAS